MVSKGFATLLLLLSQAAAAEQIRWNDYDIYYNSFKSTLIPADVAEAHNIVRGDSRIVINIAIRKYGDPVSADISGTASNLLNQLFTLQFEEITEEGAIYYLANQIVDERDALRFKINISPKDSDASYEFYFVREYISGSRE